VEILLSYIMKKPRIWILSHIEEEVSDFVARNFFRLLECLKKGYSIFHIIKEREFFSLNFYVNQYIHIPKPETEKIVEIMLEKVKEGWIIAEPCAGSGCIGISFMHYTDKKNITIILSDISKSAINILKKNAKRLLNKEKISKTYIIYGNTIDFLSHTSVNMIVSNPPYLTLEEATIVSQKNKEPFLSLYGGISGTEFSLKLIQDAFRVLKNGGFLIIETDYRRTSPLIEKAKKIGYNKIYIEKDLAGRDRILILKK